MRVVTLASFTVGVSRSDSSLGFIMLSAFYCRQTSAIPDVNLGKKKYQNKIITEKTNFITNFRKYESAQLCQNMRARFILLLIPKL
jgi:hypothetical protein